MTSINLLEEQTFYVIHSRSHVKIIETFFFIETLVSKRHRILIQSSIKLSFKKFFKKARVHKKIT
jgi:hypothetical protein